MRFQNNIVVFVAFCWISPSVSDAILYLKSVGVIITGCPTKAAPKHGQQLKLPVTFLPHNKHL